jgi:Pyruvate/2-oxoacid:ferredoxin oxidoreductase delta subunit
MKNKIRLILQSLFLALIGYVAVRPLLDPSYVADFESYCPFGGLSSLGSKLNQGTMSCNMSETQVVLGIGLLVGAVLFGKLFCSYVCPVGAITEWIGKLGDKLKIRIDLKGFIDRPMRLLKYGLLFITLYLTMTTSELFCKEYDPFYASVNLFDNSDIVLYFAIPAFVITVLGSLFFRLFWCKYLCPLGAVTNIFLNITVSGAIIIAYIAANIAGAGISLVWLLAALITAGALNELVFKRSFLTPVPKITRNTSTCSDCGLCDVKCPQGIKISQVQKVSNIDCTLCTDCVYNCPLKNTITISNSNKLRYLAPVAVIVLIAVSLGFASGFEFTTISERWGNFDTLDNVETYSQAGIKNVKCYGSAMSLKSSMENVEGIVGLDAYAKSHAVTVYYNPAVITESKVKSSLFTPIKMEVRKIKESELESLAVWDAGIDGLFDLIDFNNLFYTLRIDEGVYGFETHFGEPVLATIYYDPALTNPDKIKKQIEEKEITVEKAKAVETLRLNFKVSGKGKTKGTIDFSDYKKTIFRPYDRLFNKYNTYGKDSLRMLVFPMPDAATASLRRYLGSLSSHLSADDGIVRLSTRYLDVPSVIVYFDPSQTDAEKIKAALVKPQLTVFLSETETRDIENPFKIDPEGKVLRTSDLNIDEE